MMPPSNACWPPAAPMQNSTATQELVAAMRAKCAASPLELQRLRQLYDGSRESLQELPSLQLLSPWPSGEW